MNCALRGFRWGASVGRAVQARRRWGASAAAAAILLASAAGLAAQDAKAPRAAKPSEDATPLPPAVEVRGGELTTGDGVLLEATYFPGTRKKNSVPVILLHSFRRERTDLLGLGQYLQSLGHAVLVPDLRGHGKSTQVRMGIATQTIDAAKMGQEQFARMVNYDMETLRRFLVKKNNAEELNLEKLCVAGSEMGASVALQWAQLDWSWPQYPGVKQGQYVKALVLLSPQWTFRGLDARRPLSHPAIRGGLSIMILSGKEDPKANSEAQRLHSALVKYHPEPTGMTEDERKRWEEENKDLFIRSLDTKLQGTDLLKVGGLGVKERIGMFIELRLVRKDFLWREIGKKQP